MQQYNHKETLLAHHTTFRIFPIVALRVVVDTMFGVLHKPLPDQPVSGNAGIRTPTCITRDSGVHQQSSAINDNNRQLRQHRRPPPTRGPTTTSNTAAALSQPPYSKRYDHRARR